MSRMPAVLATVSLFLTLLSACAPMTVTYYQPDAASGRVVKAWCPPVRSYVLLDVRDVTVGFNVSSPRKDRVQVTITFEVPAKHTVQMIDRFVEIRSPSGVTAKSELFGRQWVSAGRTGEIPLDRPMEGGTTKKVFDQTTPYGKTEHAYFFLRADIDVAPAGSFLLKPPRFFVDGKEVDFPAITFIKTEETYLGSLNC